MKVVDIITKYEGAYLCIIYVDSKSDISDVIPGLPSGIELAPGSLIYTGALEVGVYKTDGTWGWK